MKCPYLSETSKRECVKMLAESIDDELSDFDVNHFCDGNPIFCYFFRVPPKVTAAPQLRAGPELEDISSETLCPRNPSMDPETRTSKPLRL